MKILLKIVALLIQKIEVEIESRNWTNGIYIIRVECNENAIAIKLIKE